LVAITLRRHYFFRTHARRVYEPANWRALSSRRFLSTVRYLPFRLLVMQTRWSMVTKRLEFGIPYSAKSMHTMIKHLTGLIFSARIRGRSHLSPRRMAGVCAALLLGIASVSAETTLVPLGAVWKYRDTGTDLGTTWTALSFNDSAWASGPAELGYGDGGEGTIVGFGPDANNKYRDHVFPAHVHGRGPPRVGKPGIDAHL
jgi:hypothetical protein